MSEAVSLLASSLTTSLPRQVGVCLKHLPSADEEPSRAFHSDTVPWQRVINSKGIISPRSVGQLPYAELQAELHDSRGHPSGAAHQAAVLRQEGVEVETGNMGELMVDLGTYGWFPEVLPSEAE